jgi:hypothetical protein
VAARVKAWIYDRSLAGIACSNPTGSIDVCLLSLVNVMCCQVEVPPSLLSLFQRRRRRSRIACGVSERDREASIMRRP